MVTLVNPETLIKEIEEKLRLEGINVKISINENGEVVVKRELSDEEKYDALLSDPDFMLPFHE